jgi:hypothetical protein
MTAADQMSWWSTAGTMVEVAGLIVVALATNLAHGLDRSVIGAARGTWSRSPTRTNS